MIKITPTRLAEKNLSKVELIKNVKIHRENMKKVCKLLVEKLNEGTDNHDKTKLDKPDMFYDAYSRNLPENEFKKTEWFKFHDRRERHHLMDYCPPDVNLIDILEQVAYIVSDSKEKSSSIPKAELVSIEILMKAYRNTIKLLNKEVESDIMDTPIS